MQFSGASPSVISGSQEMGDRDEESVAPDRRCSAGLGAAYLIWGLPVSWLRQTGKRSHGIERKEHLVSSKNQDQSRTLESSDTPLGTGFERTFAARNPLTTDAKRGGRISDPTERFRPQGVRRLYLAIVNRAILDLLENGKNSPAAKRWLLSRDFDRLQELFRPKVPNTLEVTEVASRASQIQLRKCFEKGRVITKPLHLSCCGTIRYRYQTVCASNCG